MEEPTLLTLRELDRQEFDVNGLFAMLQCWYDGESFSAINKPKPSQSLLYFNDCEGIYEFPNGKSFTARRGTVVFIPRGTEYRTTFVDCEKSRVGTMLINFLLTAPDGRLLSIAPAVSPVLTGDSGRCAALFREIAGLYERPAHSKAELKALLYRLFGVLGKRNREDSVVDSRFAVIRKGIEYLENDERQTASVEQLARRCGVSANHFRRLFKEYAGVSPLEFRLQNKMERAKQLLESGSMTVGEVSERLGFSDAAFFSRQFRKYVGVSPSLYTE